MDKKNSNQIKLILTVLIVLHGIIVKAQKGVLDSAIMLLPEISIESTKDRDTKLESEPITLLPQTKLVRLPDITVSPLINKAVKKPEEVILRDKKSIEGRLITGLSYGAYRGDLGDTYQSGGLGVHVGYMFSHNKKLHGGLHAAAGTFSGYELSNTSPDFGAEVLSNTYFRSSFISVHYSLQYDIIRRERWLLYVSQGLGIVRFNPRDEFGNALPDNPETRAENENYGTAAAVLPTQAGIDYYLPNRLGIGLKAGWLNTTTDYLDNVSQLGDKAGNDNVMQVILKVHVPF